MQQKIRQYRNSFFLFMAAFIWGIAFVAQSVGMDYMGPFTFNGARCLIGGTVLLPLIAFRARQKAHTGSSMENGRTDTKTGVDGQQNPAEGARSRRGGWKITLAGGVCCGLAICAASSFQQIGIQYTTVGKAGFLTTLYIVIVPLMGLFLGKKVRRIIWLGAVLAAAGMYLLCVNETFTLNRGDILVFVCAVLFSIHILVIDYFSPRTDGVILSCIQFYVAGSICMFIALLTETPTLEGMLNGIVPLLYAGVMSCGVGYTLQIVGQKGTDPTVASLILSLESVISVLAGWVLLGQTMSLKELAGCALVFAAVILVQLPEKKRAGASQAG